MCIKYPKVDIKTITKKVGEMMSIFCLVERKEYNDCEICPIHRGMKKEKIKR